MRRWRCRGGRAGSGRGFDWTVGRRVAAGDAAAFALRRVYVGTCPADAPKISFAHVGLGGARHRWQQRSRRDCCIGPSGTARGLCGMRTICANCRAQAPEIGLRLARGWPRGQRWAMATHSGMLHQTCRGSRSWLARCARAVARGVFYGATRMRNAIFIQNAGILEAR